MEIIRSNSSYSLLDLSEIFVTTKSFLITKLPREVEEVRFQFIILQWKM
jgi:hypothetical protein